MQSGKTGNLEQRSTGDVRWIANPLVSVMGQRFDFSLLRMEVYSNGKKPALNTGVPKGIGGSSPSASD